MKLGLNSADGSFCPARRFVLPLLILGGLAVVCATRAQAPPVAPRSVSGQFVTLGAAAFDPGFRSLVPTNSTTVELNPMLLPVSCERIKSCLLRELGADSSWQGKVMLYLRPALILNDPGITVTSDHYQNGWQYRVELPTPVDRGLYVRAIVQVLLTEMANRNPTAHDADPPAWLIDGLTRQIMLSREMEVILSPPEARKGSIATSSTSVSRIKDNPMRSSHDVVRASRALTFEEISWPGSAAGYSIEQYLSSAHLFVAGLLALPNGKACMRAMIGKLQLHENWQLAFFSAFQQHFQTPLQVEKWWTLQTVYITGRDSNNSWGSLDSALKLKEALQIPVRVYAASNSAPAAQTISIQTALRTWDDRQQKTVLAQKARELEMLRLRVASDCVGLLEDYRLLLLKTLRDRESAGFPFGIRRAAARAEVSDRAARELDRLDALLATAIAANNFNTAATGSPPAPPRQTRDR